MKANLPVNGSCLCGKISFLLNEMNRDVVICHCQQCRKQTGHLVAAASVKDSNLNVTGEEHLKWYAASTDAKRGFCNHCGSLLFWKHKDSDSTSVMAGSLEAPTGLTTTMHIFTEFKGDYYDITDGLPQHEQYD